MEDREVWGCGGLVRIGKSFLWREIEGVVSSECNGGCSGGRW